MLNSTNKNSWNTLKEAEYIFSLWKIGRSNVYAENIGVEIMAHIKRFKKTRMPKTRKVFMCEKTGNNLQIWRKS